MPVENNTKEEQRRNKRPVGTQIRSRIGEQYISTLKREHLVILTREVLKNVAPGFLIIRY